MPTTKSRNSTRSTSERNSHDLTEQMMPEQAQEQFRQQVARLAQLGAAAVRAGEIACQLQLNALGRSGQQLTEFARRVSQSRGPVDLMSAQMQLLLAGSFEGVHLAQEATSALLQIEPQALQAQAQQAAETTTDPFMFAAPWLRTWQQLWGATENAMSQGSGESVH